MKKLSKKLFKAAYEISTVFQENPLLVSLQILMIEEFDDEGEIETKFIPYVSVENDDEKLEQTYHDNICFTLYNPTGGVYDFFENLSEIKLTKENILSNLQNVLGEDLYTEFTAKIEKDKLEKILVASVGKTIKL